MTKQITLTIPQQVYSKAKQTAQATAQTVEDVLAAYTIWAVEQMPALSNTEQQSDFEQEVRAFERLLPSLIDSYHGQYVAIHKGEVIAHGEQKLALLDQVRQERGNIVCYIEQVIAETPRKVKVTSTWIGQ